MDSEKLLKVLNQIERLTKKPEKYLSLQEKEAEDIKHVTKDLYNFSKKKEDPRKKNKEALEELIITGLDEEQIWQQIELQNNLICNSLVSDIAYLLAKKNKLKFPIQQKNKNKKDCKENCSRGKGKISDQNERLETVEEKSSDTKSLNRKKPVQSSVVDDKFFKLHEMEKFLEKIEKEDESGNSEDEEIDYFEDDLSDSNEDLEEKLHYDDFFDQPEDEHFSEKKRKNIDFDDEKKIKKVKFSLNKVEDDEDENEELDEEEENEEDEENDNKDEDEEVNFDDFVEDDESDGDEKEERENDDDDDDDDDEDEEEEDRGEKDSNKQPSTFEARQERLKSRINALEEEALREKPWQLKGEVTATTRPPNSLLEEYVEFDMATRPAPVLTEKSTLKLEDVIIQRIKDKAWDDVVRKIKPVDSDIEYKKKLVLDQEKSKLSLAEIYEKEYLKQLESKTEDLLDKPEVEPPQHQEIRIMMNKLFSKLDALSNFHFTPRQVTTEVKIISNVPANTVEEVAPVTTSDATLLAPEEVKAKPKGDLIGKSERTSTDKKRERRQKKLKQKLKYEKIEAKSKQKLEKQNLKDSQRSKISDKFLQKITKSSNITQLEKSEGDKYVKSSNAFFSKLQDETNSKIKKKGFEMKKPKPGKKFNSKKSKTR